MHLLLALALAAWQPPVGGAPVTTFRVDPAAPYAAAQHRTLALRAAPGAEVRAACAGWVTFAGRLPGGGEGVTVRCAHGLLAGHTRLGDVAVARGSRVRAGEVLGRAGAGGAVALSARRASTGTYLDPAALLARPGPAAAPDRTAPPAVAPRVRIRGRPPRAPRPAARPGRAPVPARVPLIAWAGLAALAGGIGVGALWRVRGTRRSAARAARTTT